MLGGLALSNCEASLSAVKVVVLRFIDSYITPRASRATIDTCKIKRIWISIY